MPIDNSQMEEFEKPLKHSNFLQLQMEMQKSISTILDFIQFTKPKKGTNLFGFEK